MAEAPSPDLAPLGAECATRIRDMTWTAIYWRARRSTKAHTMPRTKETLHLYGDGPDPVGRDHVFALQDLGLSEREARLLLRLLLGRSVHLFGFGIIEDLPDMMDTPLGNSVLEEMEYLRPLSREERREFEALARRLDDFTAADTAAVWAYARGYDDRDLYLLFEGAPCGVCRGRRRIRAPEVADQRGLPDNVIPFRERPRGEG